VSCLLAIYCIVALFVTARYSQKPEAIEKSSPIKQIVEFFSPINRCHTTPSCTVVSWFWAFLRRSLW
jgi:hypothetical protein